MEAHMKDHSEMPRAAGGIAPDDTPWLAPKLAEAWAETVGREEKAMADPSARLRHSWAAACARRTAYDALHLEPTEPLSVADYWRFGTGTVIHERWQEVIQKIFPEGEIEKQVVIPEIPSAGHIDLFIPANDLGDPAIAVEVKSINGFGFKMAIGARGEAEGPRSSALVQGALNAYGSDAELLMIVYLSLENLSPRELSKIGTEEWQRFAAEWTYTKDQWLPLAEQEISRMRRIVQYLDEGKLPPRAIPDLPRGARVTDPMTGTWMVVSDMGGEILQSGTTWQCDYCAQRSRCVQDGA